MLIVLSDGQFYRVAITHKPSRGKELQKIDIHLYYLLNSPSNVVSKYVSG